MVLEKPCPDRQYSFVGSSLPDPKRAAREIARWARCHGFNSRPETQTFVTYHAGQPPQEWYFLERRPH